MISEDLIRVDLDNIKYYYIRKYVLDTYFNDMIKNDILALTDKYNKVMESAPIKLYHYYVLKYLKGCTHEYISNEMGFTHTTICDIQNQLIQWLSINLHKEY